MVRIYLNELKKLHFDLDLEKEEIWVHMTVWYTDEDGERKWYPAYLGCFKAHFINYDVLYDVIKESEGG